jgi:hypothetical protein
MNSDSNHELKLATNLVFGIQKANIICGILLDFNRTPLSLS